MAQDLADRITKRLEPLGEHLNPILVKEVRQALRSRRFIMAFMLALVAALSVTLVTLSWSMNGELDVQAGKHVFYGLFVCFTVIAMVIVPFEVQARHMADRAHSSVDLVQITNLSAHRILSGKLQAAGVTLVLYLSALVPFSTFSYLLKGVTPGMIGLGLVLTASAGLTAITFVLFVSTFASRVRGPGRTGGAAILLCLVGSFFVMGYGIALIEMLGRSFVSGRAFWLSLGLWAGGTVTFNVVLFTTTASRLSFPSANKETGPRLALLANNLLMVAAMLLGWHLIGGGYPVEAVLGQTMGALAWWAVVGCFVLCVPAETNERIRHSFPRLALAGYLFWPGRGRAYAFYMLNLAVLCAPMTWALATEPGLDEGITYATVSAALYAASFPGMAAAIFSITRRRWGRPHDLVRATGVFLVSYLTLHLVAWIAVMAVAAVSGRRPEEFAPLHALSPPFGVGFMFHAKGKATQFYWNAGVAAVAFIATFMHFAPLAAKDLVESFRLAAAQRRGEFDDHVRAPAARAETGRTE